MDELIFSPRLFFFMLWLQITLIVFYRATIYGDISKDAPKQLKVWDFYSEGTSISTRLLIPCITSWVIMFFMPFRITLL